MVDAGEFTALQNLVADMFVELTSLKGMVQGGAAEHHASRQLWHNDTLQSIYEFPQAAGGPIYFPSTADQFVNWYAQGQRPVLPGSGDPPGMIGSGNRRPTFYMRERMANGAADTSLGYVFSSGDTAWMLTSTALVLLMTMPGTRSSTFNLKLFFFFFHIFISRPIVFPRMQQALRFTTPEWSVTRMCCRARCRCSSSPA